MGLSQRGEEGGGAGGQGGWWGGPVVVRLAEMANQRERERGPFLED